MSGTSTQNRCLFEDFKVAHANLLGMAGLYIPNIVRYDGLIWNNFGFKD